MLLTSFLPFMLRGSASAVVVAPPETPAYVEAAYVESAYVPTGAAPPPAIPPGTLTFAQAPTDAEPILPTIVDALPQAIAAGLGITGIRHNLLMNRPDTIPWNPSRFIAQWDTMQAQGLKLYLCLFGPNTPYPATAVDRTAWANGAVTALLWLQANYPGLLAAVEVWNEPDSGNPAWSIPYFDMVLLVQAVRTAMNAQPALAGIKLAAPATVAGEGIYWQNLVDGGLLDNIDWVSHHMYSDPHVLERRITNLRAKLTQVNAENTPIFISEFGGNQTTPVNRAYEVAGSLTMLRALNIHGASHFTLRDYESFPDHGLLNSNGTIGEQGTVWKTWHDTIGVTAAFGARETIGSLSNVRCYRFTHSGATIRVIWASLGTPSILVSGGTYTAKDVSGIGIAAGGTHILTPSPIYITGNSLTVDPAAGQETLLTYPELDFSTTPPLNGWQYKSFNGAAYANAVADTINDKWTIPTSGVWQISPTLAHPAPNAAGGAAVRQWTVPSSDVIKVRVFGTWEGPRAPNSDGTDVTLLHNAAIRFRRSILRDEIANINQVFVVAANDVLEFRVGPGPGTNVTSDSTALRALIYSAAAAAAVTAPDLTYVVTDYVTPADYVV